jgi:DNA-binding CsgD family transcriptional regulator
MLERERELADCLAALGRAGTGHGGFVVIEGPGGIGKTELLNAVRAAASSSGARVLAARGSEVERELAYGAVRQLFEPVFRLASPTELERLLSGSASPARWLFDEAFAPSTPNADPTFAVLNALYWVIARLSDVQPLVLVIDDTHWLDPPSLRLLDFLLPRIEELSALALVATRQPLETSDEPQLGRLFVDPASRVVSLRPLSAAAVTELVRVMLREEPVSAFVEACLEATGGVPFYVVELLRELSLRQARPVAEQAAAVRATAPRSVSLALQFREASSSNGVAVAQALAVLGDGSPIAHIAALAGLDQSTTAEAADLLARAAIFVAQPELAFAHPIVRSAVYAHLGPRERALAHAHAARILHAAGASAERVAAHLINSGPHGDPWVADELRAAATTVCAQGAQESAARYLRRALAEQPERAVRAQILLELGRAEASAGEPDAAEHLAEAYALAADVELRADVAISATFPLSVAGRFDEAVGMLAAVADELAKQDHARALELEARLVSVAMNEPAAARTHLVRLDRVGEELSGDSRGARLMLCHLAYWRMWRSQGAAQAVELAERAVSDGQLLVEIGSEASEINSAAMTLICADRLDSAGELLNAALANARQQGSRTGFGHISFLRSMLALRRGELHDVEAEAEAVLEATLPFGLSIGAAVATALLVTALIERGMPQAAASALEAIGLADGEVPTQAPYNLVLSARGRLRIARGDLAGGLADLHECGRRNRQLNIRNAVFIPWRVHAALAHRSRGDLAAARVLASDELDAARDWGTPGAIGEAQRLAGLLGSGEESVALLQQATAALADSPARLEYARALVDLGAACRRLNRRTQAREPLTRGLDIADRCGANLLCRRALDELAAMGARPRRFRVSGLESLTSSERRVAQMAAAGFGNVEIAQTLFVTRKTVEKHLGNAYTKLGVTSRAALKPHFADTLSDPPKIVATEREESIN